MNDIQYFEYRRFLDIWFLCMLCIPCLLKVLKINIEN